eukprot:350508-Chlamydomonas_euryale.AAC.4
MPTSSASKSRSSPRHVHLKPSLDAFRKGLEHRAVLWAARVSSGSSGRAAESASAPCSGDPPVPCDAAEAPSPGGSPPASAAVPASSATGSSTPASSAPATSPISWAEAAAAPLPRRFWLWAAGVIAGGLRLRVDAARPGRRGVGSG